MKDLDKYIVFGNEDDMQFFSGTKAECEKCILDSPDLHAVSYIVSWKNAWFKRVLTIIDSCETEAQVFIADNLISFFKDVFEDKGMDDELSDRRAIKWNYLHAIIV